MNPSQLLAGEHRQALARVEQERDACFAHCARVLHHAVLAVGTDDREPAPQARA